jgi:hypothetical protein
LEWKEGKNDFDVYRVELEKLSADVHKDVVENPHNF